MKKELEKVYLGLDQQMHHRVMNIFWVFWVCAANTLDASIFRVCL
jgi:hypothetical protein